MYDIAFIFRPRQPKGGHFNGIYTISQIDILPHQHQVILCHLQLCLNLSSAFNDCLHIESPLSGELCYLLTTLVWNICRSKFVLLFFAEFELIMLHNNTVEILEKLNKQNLLKICLQATYPTDFCIIFSINIYLKKKKKKWLEQNVLCIGSYHKWFCIKSWKKFANLLLLCKL